MVGLHKSTFKNPVINWIDTRLPIFTIMYKEYAEYPTPRNFNFLWNFGALAMFMLVTMILSGILLAMHYVPNTEMAFNSVEGIMRDVNGGWLMRYIHMNGASMFFIVVYIHIFRGLYYGSYKQPREILWMLGVIILLLMMATAFMGYVLPWGQMSFWGTTVITNLFSAIPVVGDGIVTWLWGGFSVDNPTLNRMFVLHYLMPFVIAGVVFLHVWALHVVGSNNPLGIEPKSKADTLPFHPYFTIKDIFGLCVFLVIYAIFIFYAPNYMGHVDNYVAANPMVTPPHIVPEWYFLPFYAILRAVTFDIGIFGFTFIEAKFGGVLAMFGSIAVLFVIPFLDTHPVRSTRFRPQYERFFWVLVVTVMILGWVGSKPAAQPYITIGQLATLYYFGHFLIVMPWLSRTEKVMPLPKSISHPVLETPAAPKVDKKVKGTVAAIVLLILGVGLTPMLVPATAEAADAHSEVKPPKEYWPHHGVFGRFDKMALQRGFQVYKEVCAACHSMDLMHYRNLDGVGFNEMEIKAIAASYLITDGPNEEGEMFERPGLPADKFRAPYANKEAAIYANNGGYPKDLSLVVKARKYHEDYIHALLVGYEKAPEDIEVPSGAYYNKYYPGHAIKMPAPLSEGQVTYADGTEATVDQMSRDVTTFLAYASEPHLEERKKTGAAVILFLLVLTGLVYGVKRRVWAGVEH